MIQELLSGLKRPQSSEVRTKLNRYGNLRGDGMSGTTILIADLGFSESGKNALRISDLFKTSQGSVEVELPSLEGDGGGWNEMADCFRSLCTAMSEDVYRVGIERAREVTPPSCSKSVELVGLNGAGRIRIQQDGTVVTLVLGTHEKTGTIKTAKILYHRRNNPHTYNALTSLAATADRTGYNATKSRYRSF